MENKNTETEESSGMALSGMIIGIIGLICAFLPAWRSFGLIISCLGLLVSIYTLIKSKGEKGAKVRALTGLITSALAIMAASYILYLRPDPHQDTNDTPTPVELQDSAAFQEDHSEALEKLKGLTDSNATH